jgi:hypothetical protein
MAGMIKFLTASIAVAIVLGIAFCVLGAGTEVRASSSLVAGKGDRLDKAYVGNSVDRSNKSDRLTIIQRAEHNSSSANKPISSKHTPSGCEWTFSPFADPGGLTYSPIASRDLNNKQYHSGSSLPMSAMGQKRTLVSVKVMSALAPKADIAERVWDVRFVPILLQKAVEGFLGR